MNDKDELRDIPPLVPDRDDVDSHLSNRKAQGQEIVRPGYYTEKVKVSSWPMRIMVTLLFLAACAGGYGSYYFYELYQDNMRQTNLRISDLELRLALVDESATESDNTLMENIEQTIEQYDLLWANWRNNNRTFEEIQGEIARLKLANEGQDEITTNNTQQLANTNDSLQTIQAAVNSLNDDFMTLGQSVTAMNADVAELGAMRADLESIRQALSSGDSTVLGLVGRLEYIEESMESVNAHRLQINESLFRLQQNVEALQRTAAPPGGSL